MSVKYFHSGMPGAPQVNGTAGSLKAVLDACLVTGWGLAAIDSLVILNGVATANVLAGHPYEVGSVALIAGAVTSGGSVNGEQRVLSVTNNSFSFATTLVNQTASTPGTHKVAPLGWQSPPGYQSGNIAAYRSVDAAGTQSWLRLDDTVGQEPRVRGYLAMTDHSTGTDPFPLPAQVGGAGLWWATSSDSGNRPWALRGDTRTFYYSVSTNGSGAFATFPFGDFASNVAVDPYRAVIAGGASRLDSANPPAVETADPFFSNSLDLPAVFLARGAAGIGGAVQVRRMSLHVPLQFTPTTGLLQKWSGAGDATFYTYPNPAGGGLILTPIVLIESAGSTVGLRGQFRGMYYCPQWVGAGAFANGVQVAEAGLPSRILRVVNNGRGPGFIDDTGPWS